MYSAVLMAGSNNRKAVRNYKKIVEESYHERLVYTGYKALYEFSFIKNGRKITKPLIQFTLETLVQNDQISEIVIVGFISLIKNKLSDFLKTVKKKIIFVEQHAKIPENLNKEFGFKKGAIAKDSICGNMIKAYAASKAYKKKEMALFFASDTPFTFNDFILKVLSKTGQTPETAGIIIPGVFFKTRKDRFRRPLLLLVNDSGEDINAHIDKHGRIGFRVTSLIMINPYKIDLCGINIVYSLRKALSPKIQKRISRICKDLKYHGFFLSYFLKKSLSIRQAEAIMSAFFKGPVKGVFLPDVKATYDFDGTETDIKQITDLLEHQLP